MLLQVAFTLIMEWMDNGMKVRTDSARSLLENDTVYFKERGY